MKLNFIITICLIWVAFGASGQNRGLLNAELEFESIGLTVERSLRSLEKLGDFKFAYSSKSIEIHRKVFISKSTRSLENVLRIIFPDTTIQFKVVGNKVVIFKKKSKTHFNENITQLYQTVRGEIRDLESNQPLFGVNVVLLGSDPLKGASTDQFGQFKIEKVPVGRSTFRASYLGYKSKTVSSTAVNAGKELILNIHLEESSQSLDQIVIKADIDKSKPLNEMSLVSAKSFTVEETSLYAGSFNDPARMATSYAGVSSGQDDVENKIIIRGNSPRGLLWRLEGIEIPNPNHFADDGSSSGAISILNSNVIANSDFMTGAFSAEYGNAFSGVFDLKLRNGNNERREYAIKAGLLGLDASLEGPIVRNKHKNIPNASYLISYRYSTITILNSLGLEYDDGIRDPAFQDMAFKFNLPTRKWGVFSFWGVGGLSNAKDQQFLSIDGDTYKVLQKDKYNVGILGVSHDLNLSEDAFLETRASYSSTRYSYYLEEDTNQEVFVEDDENYLNNVFRLSATFNKKFNAKHATKVGAVYSSLMYDLDSRGLLGDDFLFYRANEKGKTGMWQGFINHKFDVNDELTFSGGFHYIRLDLAGQDNFEPRLGVNWQFKENQALSFGFGVHSRREETSLYFTELISPDSTIQQPNTELDLAKARHYVIGYDRNLGRDFHLRLEAYYQQLYDIPIDPSISTIFTTINEENAYIRTPLVNGGRGRNYGIELTFEKFLSRGYYFLYNGSLFRSVYLADDQIFSTQYDNKYNTGLVAGKEFRLGDGHRTLTVGVEGVLTGGKHIFPVDLEASKEAGRTVYDLTRPYSRQLDDYSRMDFQIVLKTQRKKSTHELKLDVQNLTSRDHAFYEEYSPQQQAIVPLGRFGQIIPVLSYKVIF